MRPLILHQKINAKGLMVQCGKVVVDAQLTREWLILWLAMRFGYRIPDKLLRDFNRLVFEVDCRTNC